MMIETWREALVNRLRSDPHLTDLIGTYKSLPAIYGFEPVPERTGDPWIVVPGIDISVPEPDKSAMRFEVTHTLEVWAYDKQDPTRVGAAADYVCLMFHRAKPEVPGVTVHSVIAELPIELEADGFIGRGVTLTAVLHRGE